MNNKKERKELRTFGLMVGGIFLILGLWPSLWRGEAPRLWALIPGLLLVVLGISLPGSLKRDAGEEVVQDAGQGCGAVIDQVFKVDGQHLVML